MRMSLPTRVGSMCWYRFASTLIADACRPALCANADAPTYGCRLFIGTFVTPAIAWLIRVASASEAGGSSGQPYFSCRLATTVIRFALPVRSPCPFIVPWTCTTPASTAARVFATAQPVSLWQWMPRSTPTWAAADTMSAIHDGSMPPLVSHRTTTSAPASAAVRTTSSAYSGLAR